MSIAQIENLKQNTMSFCRGEEVPATSSASDRKFTNGPKQGSEMNGVAPKPESPTTVNMTINGRLSEPARPIDLHKKAADAKLPSNPAPRSAVGQAN